jgi:hypothetical protein
MRRLGLLCLVMAGICTQVHAEDCAQKAEMNMYAKAIVHGPVGASEMVELKCGDEVIVTCTATVPAGKTRDSCTTAGKALTRGKYECVGTQSQAVRPTAASIECLADEEPIKRTQPRRNPARSKEAPPSR